MGNHVVSQLKGEFIDGRLLARAQLGVLLHQFVHRRGSGAAGGLVGRDMHAADVRHLLDRLQCHDHLDRRAVGVGDNAARGVLRIFGIDLRHHQRHVGIHAEGARIVDHDRTVSGDRLREFARSSGSGRSEGEIHPLEVVVMLQQFDSYILSAEFIDTARAALRTEQQQFADRQVALLQNPQKFLAHSTAGAHNRNLHLDKVKK